MKSVILLLCGMFALGSVVWAAEPGWQTYKLSGLVGEYGGRCRGKTCAVNFLQKKSVDSPEKGNLVLAMAGPRLTRRNMNTYLNTPKTVAFKLRPEGVLVCLGPKLPREGASWEKLIAEQGKGENHDMIEAAELAYYYLGKCKSGWVLIQVEDTSIAIKEDYLFGEDIYTLSAELKLLQSDSWEGIAAMALDLGDAHERVTEAKETVRNQPSIAHATAPKPKTSDGTTLDTAYQSFQKDVTNFMGKPLDKRTVADCDSLLARATELGSQIETYVVMTRAEVAGKAATKTQLDAQFSKVESLTLKDQIRTFMGQLDKETKEAEKLVASWSARNTQLKKKKAELLQYQSVLRIMKATQPAKN
jgi:hypothetical protein